MRVLVADDHELFLKGLEFVLRDNYPEIKLVFAHDYTEIFKILEQDKNFDLIMTDFAMPGGKGLDALMHIRQLSPQTPIVILSAVFDTEIVQQTMEAGVAGYIPKTSANTLIISAVNLVISGGKYIPPELLSNRKIKNMGIADKAEGEHLLTPRQIEVLKAASEGKSNKQIAYELNLSEGTVKLHMTAILKVLNVNNRTGAVREAERLGVLKNDK